jgi:hypothetical protein
VKLDAPASRNLHRHGPVQTFVQMHFLALGIAFWFVAMSFETPIMDAAVYGDFIGTYPAEWWAASVMLASAAYLAGIIINGNWRWSAALRLAGALWHVFTLTAFSHGGWSAPQGLHLLIWASVALSMHLIFLWWNLGDLARAVRSETWPPRKPLK